MFFWQGQDKFRDDSFGSSLSKENVPCRSFQWRGQLNQWLKITRKFPFESTTKKNEAYDKKELNLINLAFDLWKYSDCIFFIQMHNAITRQLLLLPKLSEHISVAFFKKKKKEEEEEQKMRLIFPDNFLCIFCELSWYKLTSLSKIL